MKSRRLLRILLLLGLIGGGISLLHAQETNPWVKKAQLETAERMGALQKVPNTIPGWPPTEGAPFPAVALYDHAGKEFSLEQLRGTPVLIELVAMSCAGCQAFSGGNRVGGFDGFPAQGNLGSIEDYFSRFAGKDLFSDKMKFVQIIIYNLRLEPPRASDLNAWRKHFELDRRANTFVLGGGAPLASGETFKMIPGFILLDSELNVKMTSTGHTPQHDLYRELLPLAGTMLR